MEKKPYDPSAIDASFVISSFKNKERRNNPNSIPWALLPPQEIEQMNKANEAHEASKVDGTDNPTIAAETDAANEANPSDATHGGTDATQRSTSRKPKAAFEEYRKLFLTTPKIKHRKPVFISEELRDRLDEITRKLGDKGMSASGMIENMVIDLLRTYEQDIDHWRKL